MIFNYHNFDEVFSFDPQSYYDEGQIRNIESNRKNLEGLFVDILMKTIGVKRPAKYYPSKSNTELRALHKAVIDTNVADHHKLSVLYYILLDFDAPTRRREYSTALEKSSFLPQKYQIYIKGLWHLDRLEFEVALQYLTHPSLIPTFADEILETLVRFADASVALAYYHTVQPALTSTRSIESLFSAIAKTSVTEAFYFSRAQPEYAHQQMFLMLISLVLNNSPSQTIAARSVELISLPFTAEEEAWFEEHLLHGEGRAIRKAKDTVMMRRVGTSKFTESLTMQGLTSRAIGGLDWEQLSGAVQEGLGPRLEV